MSEHAWVEQLLDELNDVDARIAVLAQSQHLVFSLKQVCLLGGSRTLADLRCQQGRWIRIAPSVYGYPGFPMTFERRLQVALLDAGAGAAGSRLTAGMVLGLDGIWSAPIEVVMGRKGHRRQAGVSYRWTTLLEPEDLLAVGMLTVTSPARTIADLGMVSSGDVIERAFEAARRKYGTTPEEVDEMLERLDVPGRRGIKTVRRVMAKVPRDGKANASELETRFFQLLRDAGLPLPVRQLPADRDDDRMAYIDYAYTEWLVFIELEGSDGHRSPVDHMEDDERFNALNAPGRQILRFTWSHVVYRPQYVADCVRKALQAAGCPLV